MNAGARLATSARTSSGRPPGTTPSVFPTRCLCVCVSGGASGLWPAGAVGPPRSRLCSHPATTPASPSTCTVGDWRQYTMWDALLSQLTFSGAESATGPPTLVHMNLATLPSCVDMIASGVLGWRISVPFRCRSEQRRVRWGAAQSRNWVFLVGTYVRRRSHESVALFRALIEQRWRNPIGIRNFSTIHVTCVHLGRVPGGAHCGATLASASAQYDIHCGMGMYTQDSPMEGRPGQLYNTEAIVGRALAERRTWRGMAWRAVYRARVGSAWVASSRPRW